MENRTDELLDEIRQVVEQYRREVPGARRAWPESIKRRCLELRDLGIKYAEISRRTGVPYFTILKWRDERKGPSFEPIAVVVSKSALPKSATVTVPRSHPQLQNPSLLATVTVTMPGGVRIEGVSVEFLRELLPSLTHGVR